MTRSKICCAFLAALFVLPAYAKASCNPTDPLGVNPDQLCITFPQPSPSEITHGTGSPMRYNLQTSQPSLRRTVSPKGYWSTVEVNRGSEIRASDSAGNTYVVSP